MEMIYATFKSAYENFMAENFPEIKVYPLEGTYLQWLDMRALGFNHKELKEILEEGGYCI